MCGAWGACGGLVGCWLGTVRPRRWRARTWERAGPGRVSQMGAGEAAPAGCRLCPVSISCACASIFGSCLLACEWGRVGLVGPSSIERLRLERGRSRFARGSEARDFLGKKQGKPPSRRVWSAHVCGPLDSVGQTRPTRRSIDSAHSRPRNGAPSASRLLKCGKKERGRPNQLKARMETKPQSELLPLPSQGDGMNTRLQPFIPTNRFRGRRVDHNRHTHSIALSPLNPLEKRAWKLVQRARRNNFFPFAKFFVRGV